MLSLRRLTSAVMLMMVGIAVQGHQGAPPPSSRGSTHRRGNYGRTGAAAERAAAAAGGGEHHAGPDAACQGQSCVLWRAPVDSAVCSVPEEGGEHQVCSSLASVFMTAWPSAFGIGSMKVLHTRVLGKGMQKLMLLTQELQQEIIPV